MTGRECGTDSHGSVERTVVEAYDERLMGIPLVLLNSVEQDICEECGAVLTTRIPDLEGLVAAAAVTRIKHALKLRGEEIKFLRKALGWTARKLAEELEVTPETVSRWENNKDPIGPGSEKLLRLIVGDELSPDAPAIDFDPREITRMRIQPVRPHGEILVVSLGRVDLKMPSRPRTPCWGEQERKIA